jgi:hypothetical protein
VEESEAVVEPEADEYGDEDDDIVAPTMRVPRVRQRKNFERNGEPNLAGTSRRGGRGRGRGRGGAKRKP